MKSKLLIIEDDSTLLTGLQHNFKRINFEVFTEMDGERGVISAIKNKPSIVLLDLMLPKLDGFEVCKRIRNAELDMPIIMLTAHGQEEDIVKGLNCGADDYVTKPFSIKELIARVNAFLRRYEQEHTNEVTFGDFKLSYAAKSLTRISSNTIIKLTPKEFGVLELFSKRADKALTRETILQAVWTSNALTTTRSVDRCINTLRQKIEIDSRKPKHIISIRDVGYKFLKN